MVDERTLTEEEEPAADQRPSEALAIVIAWCAEEPSRVGEVAFVGRRGAVLGRGDEAGGDHPRLSFVRQGPDMSSPRPPLASRHISRVQLLCTPREGGLHLDNRGRLSLRVDGCEVADRVARAGALVELGNQLSFLVERRPRRLDLCDAKHVFGDRDEFGIVGESPAVWELRRRIEFVGARKGHALVRGESGTGKELVARALHMRSTRAGGPFISRSAATLPEGLLDAELFGHAQGYPNASMPERVGLIGAANGGTLFLDEIGEMPEALQTHLLRVLDRGEYHRLGETRLRTSDLRLIAATNRDESALKFDLAARFPLRLAVPPLERRRADIPILLRHLARRLIVDDPEAIAPFVSDGEPQLAQAFVAGLVQRAYRTHVRELEHLLWRAIAESSGPRLDLSDVAAPGNDPATAGGLDYVPVEPTALTPEQIQACLDEHNGVQELTWRALRLRNRHVLARLIRQHRLILRRHSD